MLVMLLYYHFEAFLLGSLITKGEFTIQGGHYIKIHESQKGKFW